VTQNEIVELAIQGHASTRDAIRWAMRQEREACARLSQTLPNTYKNCQISSHASDMAIMQYSRAIRARSQND